MSSDGSPANVGSNDGLGLLPERETIARQAMRLEALEIENERLRRNIKKTSEFRRGRRPSPGTTG
jgi:hypothetical protein